MVFSNASWNYLVNGSLGSAVYTGYNDPLEGYLLLLLFIVVSAIILLNAGVEVSFIIGLIFFGAFSVGPSITGDTSWLNSVSFYTMLIILATELAASIYKFITKT